MAPKKKQGKYLKSNVAKAAAAKQSKPATKQKKTSTSRSVIVFTALCACVCILASVFFLGKLGIKLALPGRTIPAGVTVAGVDVGGLKKNEAVEALNAAIGDSYSTESLVVTVLDKEMMITPADSGATFDAEAAVEEAFNHGTEENPETQVDILPYLTLNTNMIKGKIQAFSGNFPSDGIASGSQIITETVDDEEVEFLELTIGTQYYDFSVDALYDIILNAYNNHRFQANYNCNQHAADSIDLDVLYEECFVEAVDAVLDPETLTVSESVVGRQFDLEAAKEALANANPGDVLRIPLEEVQPAMDSETLQSMLFRDVLGTYTAYQASGSDRATNLRLACEALDGIILNPGDTFGYNDALGKRTPEKGYKPAAAYANGETVLSYGGGICQPSSALYYCTLIADLEIVQRHCHSYASSYVPMGMDATVSWGGPDFKFKNNTDFPIRIDATAKGGSVTITLVGTDTKDYYVKMEYEVLKTIPFEIKEIETDDKSKDGDVKTSAYTGYNVQTYKLKYDKETDQLISREKEAYSAYSKRDKVVYVYKTEETKPTEPPTTDPPTTEPPATEPEPTDPPATEPPATDPPVGEAGSDVQLPDEAGE